MVRAKRDKKKKRRAEYKSAGHLEGKDRTYEAVKAAVLKEGRYSVFEATASKENADLFTRLDKDPELERFTNPPYYPWVGIRLRRK